MKDLTDYFASPIKKTDKPSDEEVQDTPSKVIQSKTDGSSNENIAKELKILSNIENSTKKKSKNVESKKKKRKRRKPSDPAVKNITELFSNSLSIISPNASFSKAINSLENVDVPSKRKSYTKISKQNKKSAQNDEIQISVAIDDKSVEDSLAQLNDKKEKTTVDKPCDKSLQIDVEFSQNSSSEGKSEESENVTKNTKNKLNAFQFMMESRNKSIGQNSPGKDLPQSDRTGEDKDYKEKLSVRKNLLQNWAEKKGNSKRKRQEEEDRDEIINQKLNKRARRLKKLLKVDKVKKVDENSADVAVGKKRKRVKVISSSSESSKDAIEVFESSKDILKSPILEIIEENAQDQVLNTTKSKATRQSLLSFFGVLNKSRKTDDEGNKNEGSKEDNTAKAKVFTPKEKKRKSKRSLKQKEAEESSRDDAVVEEMSVKSKTPSKNKLREPCHKSIADKLESATKLSKDKIIEESDDSLTSHSLRSWKMRIKISTGGVEVKEENRDKNEEKRVLRPKRNTIATYIDCNPDESSNEGETETTQIRKQKRTSRSQRILSESESNSIEHTQSNNHFPRKPLEMELNQIVLSESDDDSKDFEIGVKGKPFKVAPVFIKATPKPKLAPEVIEARKQFLMSGIPCSLKKVIEKQQSLEDREYDIFPSVSHVQQRCESPFWNLSRPQLDFKPCSPLKIDSPSPCVSLTNSHIVTKVNIETGIEKVNHVKTLLNTIKADNPNYPVYKSFRLIHEKSGKTPIDKPESKQSPKRKRKKKQNSEHADKSVEIIEPDTQGSDLAEHAMWTEKYKPKRSDDIIGNSDGVKKLKKWLETWLKFSQEIKIKKKRGREDSTSESEFDTTDCDSRDSTRLPGNTVIVGGPCGSGKSTAIYAICKELGFNVIEINASSKRTGKRLLQELQEATQSHQVRKSEQNMQNFLLTNAPKETEPKEQQTEKKMCVLLIEDVDIVFEQDDGFISALTQLVATSKRPIIMTTTDSNSVYAQKFVSQYEYIPFLPLSSQTLAVWLQIVCLVEGLFVNQVDVGSLLEYNAGDVRKTLLQLQFWGQSGGQIIRDKSPIKIKTKRASTEEKMCDDEQPSFKTDKSNKVKIKTFEHSNCISSFEIFRDHKIYSVPYYLNLGLLWWNIPNILHTPNFSQQRLDKITENKTGTGSKGTFKRCKASLTEKMKLRSIEKLYDSLAFTDVKFRKVNYLDGIEPNVKNYCNSVRDSLELSECVSGCDGYLDFAHEITHSLVNGYVEEYNGIEGEESTLDMAVPGRLERRWRAKHHVFEDIFQEAVPFSCYVERKSVALDYLPSLRNISRSECRRAANNTKRGNRFRNYLRDLNINFNDSTLKLACNILTMNDKF